MSRLLSSLPKPGKDGDRVSSGGSGDDASVADGSGGDAMSGTTRHASSVVGSGGGGAAAAAGGGAGAGAGGDPTFALRDGLATLVELIEGAVRPGSIAHDRGCCVLVDDISLLTDVGVALGDVLHFVSELRQRFTCGDVSTRGCVVLMCHGLATDPTGEEEDVEGNDGGGGGGVYHGGVGEVASLARHLRFSADVTLAVTALRTGYSREVHGQVSLTEIRPGTAEPTTSVLQYKTRDSGVSFFAPGTSSAVL